MPDVRLGLASGAVVMRLGDVFGPPVNLAARLTAVARRNRVIIDAATAELLPADQFETRRLPGPAGARLRGRGAGRRTPALTAVTRRAVQPTTVPERCLPFADARRSRTSTGPADRRVWRGDARSSLRKEFDLLHA